MLLCVQYPPVAVEDLKQDVAVMRSALEEAHPGLYRYTPKAEMSRAFDALSASITSPITSLEFYKRVCPVIARIKCGHTGVLLPPDVRSKLTQEPLLPVDLKLIGENLYIKEGLTTETLPYAGYRIEGVNGMSTHSIVKGLLNARSGDGDGETGKRFYLCAGFRANLLLDAFYGVKAPCSLLLSKGAIRRTLQIKNGLTDAELREEHARLHPGEAAEPPFRLTFTDGDVAVLRVTSFAGTDTPAKYTEFFDQAFKEIAQHHSRTLIIDVRGNGGGFDSAGRDLVVHLAEKPFQYYRDLVLNSREFTFRKYTNGLPLIPQKMVTRLPNGRLQFTGHDNWGTQQPKEPLFKGKVIALIDGGSFSTTGECMSVLKGMQRATFVGEESGAGVTGNNSGPSATLTLPHSKVGVLVQMLRYEVNCGRTKNPRRGILPDIEVVPTIDDLTSGRDPVMQKAISLALSSAGRQRSQFRGAETMRQRAG